MDSTADGNIDVSNDIKIKPMRGRPLKSKNAGDSNVKHAYKGFNRVKKRKMETPLPDLLFDNKMNYKGELDNREVSLEEYMTWYFGYEKARELIKPMEKKLQEGLKIDLSRKAEILRYLHLPNIMETSSPDLKEVEKSDTIIIEQFTQLPSDLFVQVPKISKIFTKDFLLEIFKQIGTECKEPPLSLINKLKRLQLNIEGLKTRFIKEIPEIDIIARSDFIIIENETCYKQYLNKFKPLFREVMAIKERVIKLNSDNEFSRLLISKSNNFLKILKNSVYYREVFLKEYQIAVSSMGMKLDIGKDYESKIILSLLREGVDPSRIYFNKEKKPEYLKQSVEPDNMIINTLKKKLTRKGRHIKEEGVKFSDIYENEIRETAFMTQGVTYTNQLNNSSVVFNTGDDKYNTIDFRNKQQFEPHYSFQDPFNHPNNTYDHHMDPHMYRQNRPVNYPKEAYHRNLTLNQNPNIMYHQNRTVNQPPNAYNPTIYPQIPSIQYNKPRIYHNNTYTHNNYAPILNYSHNIPITDINPYDTHNDHQAQYSTINTPRTQDNVNLSLIITRIYQLMLEMGSDNLNKEKEIIAILNESRYIIHNFLNKLNSVNLQFASPNELIKISKEFGFEIEDEPKNMFLRIQKTHSLISRLIGIYGKDLLL